MSLHLPEYAEATYPLLEPYPDRFAGHVSFLCDGSVSQLLGMLALSLRPTRGRIRMFGHDITRLPREALPALRRKIGLVSQDYRLLPQC